ADDLFDLRQHVRGGVASEQGALSASMNLLRKIDRGRDNQAGIEIDTNELTRLWIEFDNRRWATRAGLNFRPFPQIAFTDQPVDVDANRGRCQAEPTGELYPR